MTPSAEPAAELSRLPKADGSATFARAGYTVMAAVNGPIEAGRRDEDSFQAVLDVIVRPGAGVGGMGIAGTALNSFSLTLLGTAERQLEAILQQALRQLVPVRNFPRTLIQITLQVSETPENAYANTKLGQAQLVR